MMPFAEILRYWLGVSGMRQTNLAEKLGVSKSVVTHWVTGEHYPTYARIEQMAEIFGVDLATFYKLGNPRGK
jgi:transcriptional regulator with XRE-family HTH domain